MPDKDMSWIGASWARSLELTGHDLEAYRPQPKKKTMTLTRGGKYNWIGQPERLVYQGKLGSWRQFSKVGDKPTMIWCKVLDEDLHMLEPTKETPCT